MQLFVTSGSKESKGETCKLCSYRVFGKTPYCRGEGLVPWMDDKVTRGSSSTLSQISQRAMNFRGLLLRHVIRFLEGQRYALIQSRLLVT